MASGIYRITNTTTGRVYVGSAIDLNRRWAEHRKTLRSGRHKNQYLQSSWARHGEDAFVFSTVWFCAPTDLLRNEQHEIDAVVTERGWNSLYNLNPTAGSRLGAKLSAEAHRRIGDIQRGKPGFFLGHRHTDEAKRKISLGHLNPSEETRRKMSAASLGRKHPPRTAESRLRYSEAARARTGSHSEQLRRKWSQERSGVPWGMKRRAAEYVKSYVTI